MDKIDWVHVRHEEAAAFAAGAEAHLTGQLAVCAGSCGPGNLHLINGLFDCQRSRVPVLAIAAHIPSSEIGSDYFQETHPEQLFRECSHYGETGLQPEQMPRVFEMAMRVADRRARRRRGRDPGRRRAADDVDAECRASGWRPRRRSCGPTEAELGRAGRTAQRRPARSRSCAAPAAPARTTR